MASCHQILIPKSFGDDNNGRVIVFFVMSSLGFVKAPSINKVGSESCSHTDISSTAELFTKPNDGIGGTEQNGNPYLHVS